MIDAALEYLNQGYCVIPIKRNKRPYLMTWAEYQDKMPTADSVKKWWSTWPDANIGIVTGNISGICVVDVDSKAAGHEIKKLLPDILPTVTTPGGGWHFYFANSNGLGNATGVIKDVDFRGQGGYIVAPPSIGENGKAYELYGDSDINRNNTLPLSFINILSSSSIYINSKDHANDYVQHESNTSATIATFTKGTRDNDLFHLANSLVKGGMPEATIRKYLHFFASNCDPPFTPKESELKIKSALDRENKRSKNLTSDLREWIVQQNGNFSATNAYQDVTIATLKEKAKIRAILSRFVKEKFIEPVGKNAGIYRKIEDNLEWLDIEDADTKPFPVYWPAQVERLVNLPKGGLVLVAGQVGAGKTTYLLNLAKLNMNRGKDVIFISTETNAQGLRIRLDGFGSEGISIKDLKKGIRLAYHAEGELADAIERHGLQDSILIIDYLEVEGEFWEVGKKLSSIFRKMDNGIVFVGLQMKGESLLGGNFGFHRPEIVLTLKKDKETRYTRATIEKCRWPANPGDNPLFKSTVLSLKHGCIIHQMENWEWKKK